ncbi:hypothetical protein [Candidatus Nanohalovita haloferacivicina]|uniref:hypothetical protein n=1 Tax=Candidatus Nanohalovita haloferacivicina TaxID=2978046 RepID=UPI00325FC3C9|nr:hypothetical protein HBNXNv_1172 [Candidatus Nanohalobia archaeon BNXNv]
MLQTLVAIGHEIVRSSWIAASVLVKYYLAATVLYLLYRKDLNIESFQENLVDNSRTVIFSLLGLGIVLAVSGLQISPVFGDVSQLIALGYLAYLFWVY